MKHHLLLALVSLSLLLLILAGCGGSSGRNHPPEITRFQVNGADPTKEPDPKNLSQEVETAYVAIGSTAVVTCYARDSDRDKLTYTWTGADTTTSPNDPNNSANVTSANEAIKHVSCTVRDDRDGVTVRTVAVRFLNQGNHPPENIRLETPGVTRRAGDPIPVPAGGTLVLVVTSRDIESDPMTYEFLADKGSFDQKPDQAFATYKAPSTPGTDRIRVIVSDNKGGRAASEVLNITITAPPA